MCGITGIIDPFKTIDPSELQRFTEALSHRGPDGFATKILSGVGLGHTRLAILDLSPLGACPMSYRAPNGVEYWITFNGEVYNFLELRAELVQRRHVFRSQTDTEVLAAAFAEWGENALHRCNGMFAFAIVNQQSGEVFLARDRFGVKPLYFRLGSRFVFASEIKAFLVLADQDRAIHGPALTATLTQGNAAEGLSEETMLRGVRRLPPGCCMRIDRAGRVRASRWWHPESLTVNVPATYEEQVEEFRRLFLESVALRMRSDVPLASAVSGGLDSSSVIAAMSRVSGERRERVPASWKTAFVATFPGTNIDERRFAEVSVEQAGFAPCFLDMSAQPSAADVVSSVWSMEEVSGALAVPVWALYREMRRRGFVVSIDGHGADELLGGYDWHLSYPQQEANGALRDEFETTILPGILRNYDRCSMAHGVEVRSPFLDYRLVSFAQALPPSSKLGAGYTKRILRDAMRGCIPDQVRTRRWKVGFNSPFIEWFNGSLGELLLSLMTLPTWEISGALALPEIASALREKTASRAWQRSDCDLAVQVWKGMNVVLWHLLFIEGLRPQQLGEVRV